MIGAYSVFANGGFKLQPYIVSSIRDERGNVIAAMPPPPSGDEAMRAIDARNAFLMDSMLRDVTIYGTAARASVTLKRQDLAGKTGTTNDYLDAWFCGYQKTVSACAWVGFDQPKKLGDRETGGAVALPIWIGYMKTALKNVPISLPEPPEGLVKTGSGNEMVYVENKGVKPKPENGEEEQEEEEIVESEPPKPELDKPPTD
jgi:penicillin-binding protein 1A